MTTKLDTHIKIIAEDGKTIIETLGIQRVKDGYLETTGESCFGGRFYPTKDPKGIVEHINRSLHHCHLKGYENSKVVLVYPKEE